MALPSRLFSCLWGSLWSGKSFEHVDQHYFRLLLVVGTQLESWTRDHPNKDPGNEVFDTLFVTGDSLFALLWSVQYHRLLQEEPYRYINDLSPTNILGQGSLVHERQFMSQQADGFVNLFPRSLASRYDEFCKSMFKQLATCTSQRYHLIQKGNRGDSQVEGGVDGGEREGDSSGESDRGELGGSSRKRRRRTRRSASGSKKRRL